MDRNGTLYISGGGEASDSKGFDSLFFAELKDAPLLYIPFAWESADYSGCRAWLTRMLALHYPTEREFLMVNSEHELSDLDLSEIGGIYLGGGNTYKLYAALNRISFFAKIQNHLAAGKFVYGGSAGGIIFGRSLAAVIEERYADYPYEKNDGFSFLGSWSIRCHATESNLPNLRKISSDAQLNILAPAEGSGLILKGNALGIFGSVWSVKNGSAEKVGPEVEITI